MISSYFVFVVGGLGHMDKYVLPLVLEGQDSVFDMVINKSGISFVNFRHLTNVTIFMVKNILEILARKFLTYSSLF